MQVLLLCQKRFFIFRVYKDQSILTGKNALKERILSIQMRPHSQGARCAGKTTGSQEKTPFLKIKVNYLPLIRYFQTTNLGYFDLRAANLTQVFIAEV